MHRSLRRVLQPAIAALWFTTMAAWGQPSVPTPTPPPAATPMPKSAKVPSPPPSEAPTMPGEMRPEKPVAPLVTVPLGRGAGAPEGPAASRQLPGSNPVDDAMARCKAVKPGAERNDCLRNARITAPKP